MKRVFTTLTFAFALIASAAYGQDLERFSRNPIPMLNVVGIALSEDAATARNVIEDFYRKQLKLGVEFPVLIDPSYKKLGAQKAIDISFFGKSATGKKYSAAADSLLSLNANPFTLLVIDRSRRVRAFTQGIVIDPRNVSRVVEELLLNLDGKELITVDSGEPSMAEGWQTDLGKQNVEKEKKGLVISIGPKQSLWYSLLGGAIPDVPLQTLDAKDTTLYDALGGKVSAVFVWLAPAQPDIAMVSAGTGLMLQFVGNLYHSFGLGEAKPGDEDVKNAVPEAGQPKKE